jgi:hypothetical protein
LLVPNFERVFVLGFEGISLGVDKFKSKAILPYDRFGVGGRMTVLTITAKGQVTLKQDLLKHLGVSPGEKIEADKLPDGGSL